MLAHPEAVEEAALGKEGLLSQLAPRQLWINCSTVTRPGCRTPMTSFDDSLRGDWAGTAARQWRLSLLCGRRRTTPRPWSAAMQSLPSSKSCKTRRPRQKDDPRWTCRKPVNGFACIHVHNHYFSNMKTSKPGVRFLFLSAFALAVLSCVAKSISHDP